MEPSYLGGEGLGFSRIIAAQNIWWNHPLRECLDRDLIILLMTWGESNRAAEIFASSESSVVNLLLYCIIFMTMIFGSEGGIINP